MQVRPVQESDIEQVIRLFHVNYGVDYAMPEFYDRQWVKRSIYSDHIIWLVIEDEGRVVATGACILNFGDYNDQIGEIGRVVVDPDTAGKGLGRMMLAALVDASHERVEFAFAEARTVHPKTQKINDHIGLVPLGFLPMYYHGKWRESVVIAGQLFGNGRSLRRVGAAEVIAPVAPLARLSLRNLKLDEPFAVGDDARAYPLDQRLQLNSLTGSTLLRLLKMEQGRVFDPEVFGGLHIDEGLPQLEARKAAYLVASDGERTLGAVGYLHDERHQSVRIIELIAPDEAVRGGLLRAVVERAEQEHEAQLVKCDVSAYSPRIQQTLFEMGFLPAAYIPGMVFHGAWRIDLVKMMKLTVPWDLGPLELTDASREYFALVAPAFERAAKERMSKLPVRNAAILKGLTPLEAYFFQRVCQETTPAAGTRLAADALHIVLNGKVEGDGVSMTAGASLGADALWGGDSRTQAVAGAEARVLTLTRQALAQLCEQHPRLGVKLYQNLAAMRG